MSNVQLSNSTLERMVARRTFPQHAKTGVCRSLFGPVDHDGLNREMKSTLREIFERDQRRWNFDFETDTPLEGDYAWEQSPGAAVPGFYRDSVQVGKTRIMAPARAVASLDSSAMGRESCPARDIPVPCPALESRLSSLGSTSVSGEINQENRSDRLNSGITSGCKTVPCVGRKRAPTTTTTTTSTTTTTHITDFYAKRKRLSDTKQHVENDSQSPPSIPTEQTPRKRIR
ncbi:cyclin-dependent kinase inhibitor 1C [Amia ocellicauda]|uniref:cyclin-dependent kinase inhibitor 1C n=1 Tax=Amia ocellicauda TaxID=2972642 RepID=UPI003464219C|nr:CDN1C inhibitor [Amia calva]